MFGTKKHSLFAYIPVSTVQYGITPSRPDPDSIMSFKQMSELMQQSAPASSQSHADPLSIDAPRLSTHVVS
jgi:hypothetical protein